MRTGSLIYIVGLLIGLGATNVTNAESCPENEAKFVEENLPNIVTWRQFATFYMQHKECDIDALRYAFTQQIAHLAANDIGMRSMEKVLNGFPQLRPVIFSHLGSEAISSNDRQQILTALHYCQPGQKRLCRDVKKIVQ